MLGRYMRFNLDSDAILLGYPRYAEHTERLHRHHWKVKKSSLPARDKDVLDGRYFNVN